MLKKILIALFLGVVLLIILGVFFGETVYKNENFGFSFKHPAKLVMLEEDIETSYIKEARLLLSINKFREYPWGLIYVVPKSYKSDGNYSHSEPIFHNGRKLIINGSEVQKAFHLTDDGTRINGIKTEIGLRKDPDLKVVFFMAFRLAETESERTNKEKVFDKIISSFKYLE